MKKTKSLDSFYRGNPIEEMSLKSMFDEFVLQKIAKNLSLETLKYYENCFRYFMEFIDEDLSTSNINKHVINEYSVFLQDKGIADKTIESYIIGLRAILYYAMKEGYIQEFLITIPKTDDPIHETYTDSELKVLLEKPNIEKCLFSEYRNWVLVNYFLATGCRLSTATSVRVQDIDFNNEVIHHHKQKNRK